MAATRVLLIILDSLGIGGAHDADKFFNDKVADTGTNTLGHCLDFAGKNLSGFALPNLQAWGLGNCYFGLHQQQHRVLPPVDNPRASWGWAQPQARGKDTTIGHWEICGQPIREQWTVFPDRQPSIPPDLIEQFVSAAKIPGVLGNCRASGTEIINRLGDLHLSTAKPIFYTSADSVIQIAAAEELVAPKRLYEICQIVRKIVDQRCKSPVGRIIARPFIPSATGFVRTANRRDFALPPPRPNLLSRLEESSADVTAIGKIADIFCRQGINEHLPAGDNSSVTEQIIAALECTLTKNKLIFANFNDFDSKYGHRRDLPGYCNCIAEFDQQLATIINHLSPNDFVVITADHGNDPSWSSSDHTREAVPILFRNPTMPAHCLGERSSFSDIGQSLAKVFNLQPLNYGEEFL